MGRKNREVQGCKECLFLSASGLVCMIRDCPVTQLELYSKPPYCPLINRHWRFDYNSVRRS